MTGLETARCQHKKNLIGKQVYEEAVAMYEAAKAEFAALETMS